MSIRLPGLVSNSSWWAPFHEYSTTGRKLEGGELKGTHTHTQNKKHENGPSLKIWLLLLEWYFLFYLAVCCQCSYFYHFFLPPEFFVLDVDYYKDGKISSSSSELHGSLVVMACIKLAPREQGSGWTSLEEKNKKIKKWTNQIIPAWI